MVKAESVFSDFIGSCRKHGVRPTQYLLIVSVASQTVSLFENTSTAAHLAIDALRLTANDYKLVKKYPCSTSRFGIGQTEGSNRTPLRLHRIAEKIGAGAAAGTVYKGRQAVGHVSQPELARSKITTRIMWLDGLEPGFNRGGNVDSHSRYIYIHGTADQASIGKPDSCGCIHLADNDLVPLFDLLPGGTLVWICE
ncbi:MAG TPA: L,D-transpeptidase [Candidatus Sulfotelmatobacter sp.]|nr:L,D-transpeptidase [Candidatus Sulfotelmatobacter sp.]